MKAILQNLFYRNVCRNRLRFCDCFILAHTAVINSHAASCVLFKKFGIVRDYDNEFILAHLFQKRRDFFARLHVEITRGFVRKNNGRIFCESACNDSPREKVANFLGKAMRADD